MDKRIYVYVTPFFPSPGSWRGSYCYDFVKELKRRIVDGRAACIADDVVVLMEGDGSDYEVAGISVFTFKARRLPSNAFPLLFKEWNQQSFLDKLSSIGVDTAAVVICHGHTANYCIYPLAIKRVNPKCRPVLHHHDLQSFGLNLGVLRHCSVYNAWLFCRMRKLFEQIDTHVFISEKCRESFLKAPDASWTIYDDYKRQMRGPAFFHRRPVRIKRSIILHNGVDTSIFHPAEKKGDNSALQLQLSTTTKPFTIGCIGNFIDLKDQVTLIKAAALLKDPAKVVFVGSGPMLESCKQEAKKLGVDAEFRTEMRHEELADFYRKLDLFVLPSYFEGFGCVLTEAHACGVPFVACAGQGSDDLFRSGDEQWLFKPRDVLDLAKKIEWYCLCRDKQILQGNLDFESLVGRFVEDLSCA